MQTVEWNIPENVWSGLNTKYDPTTKQVGVDDFIEGSVNYDLSPTGNITKRSKTNLYNATPLAFPIKDEFEMIFESGTRHKLVMSNGSLYYTTGDGIFHLVHAGYVAAGNMEFAAMNDLVYFDNGIDDAQVYDNGASYGGVTGTPPRVANAGVTAPITAPTFAADSAGGAVPAGVHLYKVTFLYRDTQESNGGPASASHTVTNPNNTVNLTAVPIGGLGVTARKIYRDNNDGVYLLVGTISNNTATTFADTAALGTLPIPTDNNAPPKWSLVTQFRDRLWVAGVADAQSTLYYSDAGLPDVWPTNNFIACHAGDSITALTSFNDKVIVFNKQSFGVILGTTSDDFRYIDVSPNLGCVDNRSLQTITVNGVPKLQWLSQFGMYQWDGSNIEPISDKIDNLLRFNIQQSQGSFNRNIQTSQADFLAGTYTPGINLDSVPASVTTRGYMEAGDPSTLTDQPTKSWDSQVEWQNGSSTANLVTELDESATSVLNFLPSLASMTLSGLVLTGLGAGIAAVANVTGESHVGGGAAVKQVTSTNGNYRIAQPINLNRAGFINSVRLLATCQAPSTLSLKVWADSAGVPGAVLYNGPTQNTGGLTQVIFTDSGLNVACSAGTVWIGAEFLQVGPGFNIAVYGRTDVYFTLSNTTRPLLSTNGGAWNLFNAIPSQGGAAILSAPAAFTFTQTAVAASGTMSSPVYDSLSTVAANPVLSFNVNNPTGGTISVVTTAADDISFVTGVVTHTNNLTSPTFGPAVFGYTVTLTNKRYWKYVSTLSVTDDRNAISTSEGTLSFPNLTWISEAIDHTADITSLDALNVNSSIPSGTALTVTIATSTDNITYSGFTNVGSAIPRRYSKIRAALTKSTGNVSPILNSIQLNWSLTSVFTSYAIDTVITPIQWGLFQTDTESMSGVVTFAIRSATTQGGLSAAIYSTVANGDIIPVALNQWVQWKVTISSSINQVPEVHSVVVNWLNVTNTGIRVASIFYNQTYYMAAAEFNSLTNNIVLYYDKEGRWGQYTGLNINTMGLFFGQAYFGDATVGNYMQWLNATITNDDSISVDVRTKAYSAELVSSDRTKALRHMIVEVEDSLATITPSYSIDEGQTWLPMVDVVTGFPNFFGSGTSKIMHVRFVPESQTIVWGYSIICRITNNDPYPLNISSMRAKAYVSSRPVLTR